MRILIIEDDADLAEAVVAAFAKNGVACDLARNAGDAEHLVHQLEYRLAILDLGLPDEDGLSLLRRLRQNRISLPIIILTARGDPNSRVRGLRDGADDFLVKPFFFDELHARVDALLRRSPDYSNHVISFGSLTFDTWSKEATVANDRLKLSKRELDLLEPLVRRGGHVVPRSLLEDQLFGIDGDLASNAIEVYVHRLRGKLRKIGQGLDIETIRGVGYMLTVQ
ncbi:MAG: response regulator [Proteobacteria bacterium]|nr:response regulator [Pseudomonadota bacterium]